MPPECRPASEIYITMKQSLRGMIEKIDFFTSFGHGEGGNHRRRLSMATTRLSLLINDLAVWVPDPRTKEFTVASLRPSLTKEMVQETCGWQVRFTDDPTETPAPTEEELHVLRELKSRTRTAHTRTS